MTRWALVADLNRCVGCQTCTAACKHANATAPGIQWRKVLDVETGAFPDVRRAFVPVGCMHCDDPPCLDVCPSTATGKRADGIVTIDYDLCIGCAYCAVACPYQARARVDRFAPAYGGKAMRHETVREDPGRIGVAQKCTLCADRIDTGLARGLVPGVDAEATPVCVQSCIAGALHVGDTDDPASNVSVLLSGNRSFRMHEELGTGPGIFYLWAGPSGEAGTYETAAMVAEPVGLTAVAPALQKNWDWRAAANFMAGGSGGGLFVAAALAGFFTPIGWQVPVAAMALVVFGLTCVWFEIGRPWRFLNVYLHARRSWMTREALVAPPLLGCGLAVAYTGSLTALVIGAGFGLAFLYCQGRILQAAKGIPAWRQPGVVWLIVVTGLAEGLGLFVIAGAVLGLDAPVSRALTVALVVLVGLRHLAWRAYRAGLGAAGAPTKTFEALDAGWWKLTLGHQTAIAGILLAGLAVPALGPIGAALVVATGWGCKYTLVVRAGFNQGFAVERMPARGAGTSAPGIKPGWVVS